MSEKILSVQIGDETVYLINIEERPWVAIDPLCDVLHIDASRQTKRLERHARATGLELRFHTYIERLGRWTLLPLEEISWWLRTLRPANPLSIHVLQAWRRQMPWYLITRWVSAHGRYATQSALRASLRHTAERIKPRPPVRRSGITKQMFELAKGYHAQGLSQAESARAAGMSAATFNQLLLGKYPCELRDAPEGDPNPITCPHCKSKLNA